MHGQYRATSPALRTPGGLSYAQVYMAMVRPKVRSEAALKNGFPVSTPPPARPRLRIEFDGVPRHVPMDGFAWVDSGTIWTSGLDSCVAIAVGAYDIERGAFCRVALAHLLGSYYPGGQGVCNSGASWTTLVRCMPPGWPPSELFAVVAGSSHRGGWHRDRSIMGGSHREGYPSHPDAVCADLGRLGIPPNNVRFYGLAPKLCSGMSFGIRLSDGVMGEPQ